MAKHFDDGDEKKKKRNNNQLVFCSTRSIDPGRSSDADSFFVFYFLLINIASHTAMVWRGTTEVSVRVTVEWAMLPVFRILPTAQN